MRNLISKLMTGGMIAGAALLVSACGGSETTTADTNMAMDNTAMEGDMGSMNDVTAVDGAMGADSNMAMDNSSMGTDNMSMDNGSGSMMGDNMSNGM